MYAGHFAAGLAIRAAVPETPSWAVFTGVGLLDLLFGVFVIARIEHATMTPGHTPGFSLDFIDWSHSLAMSLLWAALFGAMFWKRGLVIASAIAAAVFSHFLLDLPMHPADLALYPHSQIHLGFGLWRRLPAGWWWVEAVFIAAGLSFYFFRSRREKAFGNHAVLACLCVALLHILNRP